MSNKWVKLPVPKMEGEADEVEGGDILWAFTLDGRSLSKAYVVRTRCAKEKGNLLVWSKWSQKFTFGVEPNPLVRDPSATIPAHFPPGGCF